MRIYRHVIDVGDATVLFLYKGRMSGISPATLKKIYHTWRPVFANDVFACFVRRGLRGLLDRKLRRAKHYEVVREFLGARKLRRCKDTTFFVHIPKTAGTTVWEAVAGSVPAKLYCENYEAFGCHPPVAANFDLIGGHVSLPILARWAGPNDRFASVLRDPLARFRSAFLHCRRAKEDVETFTPAMRMMRERPLADFLSDPGAPMEICQQTIMLGFAFDRVYGPEVEQEVFDRARAALDQSGSIFATARQLPDFIDRVRARLHLPPLEGQLPLRNASDMKAQARDIEEFEAFVPTIRGMLAMEQELYDIVARRENR